MSELLPRRLHPRPRIPSLAGLPLLAIRSALLEWFRAAELLSRAPRRGADGLGALGRVRPHRLGVYVTRDQQADARAEAGKAYDHYRDRFRRTFEDAGESLETAADRMSDWLQGKR